MDKVKVCWLESYPPYIREWDREKEFETEAQALDFEAALDVEGIIHWRAEEEVE